jgi:hypothetical protein
MTSSSSLLPVELVEQIVLHLRSSHHALRSSALISRIWLYPSQQLIFRTVTLNSQEQHDAFVKLLAYTPHIGTLVRCLHISGRKLKWKFSLPTDLGDAPSVGEGQTSSMLLVARSLTRLEHLGFDKTQLFAEMRVEVEDPSVLFVAMEQMRTVTSLVVGAETFGEGYFIRFMRAFPQVVSVRLSYVLIRGDMTKSRYPPEEPLIFSRLRHLDLGDQWPYCYLTLQLVTKRAELSWVVQNHGLSGVSSLSLYMSPRSPHDLWSAKQLIEILPGLRNLRLEVYSDGHDSPASNTSFCMSFYFIFLRLLLLVANGMLLDHLLHDILDLRNCSLLKLTITTHPQSNAKAAMHYVSHLFAAFTPSTIQDVCFVVDVGADEVGEDEWQRYEELLKDKSRLANLDTVQIFVREKDLQFVEHRLRRLLHASTSVIKVMALEVDSGDGESAH